MLTQPNAHELTQIARELGAQALDGPLHYPGPETGDWEIGDQVLSEVLYQLRGRRVVLIVAAVEGGEQVHLCGVCGFELGRPGAACPRCALVDEEAGVELEGQRLVEGVEEWLRGDGEEGER